MQARKVTPKSVVLDLLRVTPDDLPVPVSSLVEIGALFGFNGNAVRVAVTRLVQAGLLESDERGSYRLAPQTDPLNRLIDEWRLGAARLRPWKGAWLAIWYPSGTSRSERSRSHRAMRALGFREGLDGLWVRPDNLAVQREELRARLRSLGLVDAAELIGAEGFSLCTTNRWTTSLWPVWELQDGYRDMLRDLQRSVKKLRTLPPTQGLVQSFALGGAAIRLLALDPLLPKEICSPELRHELTESMLRYDRLGRALWREFSQLAPIQAAPSHLSVTRGLHV